MLNLHETLAHQVISQQLVSADGPWCFIYRAIWGLQVLQVSLDSQELAYRGRRLVTDQNMLHILCS